MCLTWKPLLAAGLALVFTLGLAAVSGAASSPMSPATGSQIDAGANETLKVFKASVGGADVFLKNAKGVLIFPAVYSGGLVVGGEFGRGVLRIGNKSQDYYTLSGVSFGLTAGGQKNSIMIVFLTQEALDKFRASQGWEVGVDASVALIKVNKGTRIDTQTYQDPVVGFVFDQKGVMVDLSLRGSKVQKMEKITP
jgi:lipid-binding SYLF domain-containing protein